MALFTHHIPGGSFTCAMPVERVYLLAFEYPPNNCLSPEFIGAFSICLSMIRERYPPGVLITTSRIPNFYSSSPIQDEPMVWALFRQILTYPMPTLALINGDTIGHGLLLALCHDLRVQNKAPSAFLRICNGPPEPYSPTKRVARLIKTCVSGSFKFDAYQLKLNQVKKGLNPRDALKGGFVQGIGHLKEALGIIERVGLLDVGSDPAYLSSKEETNRLAISVCDADVESNRYPESKELGSPEHKL